MTCPNCKKYSYCGCKSCHKRKGLSSVRTSKMSGENIKCPYCRESFSIDYVETENYLRSFEVDKDDILTYDNTDGTENPINEQW
jgi:NAD-dependent SIR2 family protein deacetylase